MKAAPFRRFDSVIVCYVALGALLAYRYELRFDAGYFFNYEVDLQYITVVLLVFYCLLIGSALWARFRGEDLTLCGPNWRSRVRRKYLTLQHAIDFVRCLVILKLLFVTYSCIKQAIPLINGSNYDRELLQLDIILHGGLNLVSWSAKTFSSSSLAGLIDGVYFSWYYAKAALVALFIVIANRSVHNWYMRAFCLLWIVGGICALLFPSLGPVYTDPHWFKELHTPVAKELQSQLWLHYQQLLARPSQPSIFAYEGIAAFPSLHVALMALNTIFAFKVRVWLGCCLAVYTAMSQFGSFYLGWHYALDGYFGALLAYILYRWTRPR